MGQCCRRARVGLVQGFHKWVSMFAKSESGTAAKAAVRRKNNF
ncbi:hypothetical protein SAMN05216315_1311 [Nitrosospira sp. Nsp18]|nr:hypothetical protein SAMN05216315_1311 [Nitrosospira sp. Nsp18]